MLRLWWQKTRKSPKIAVLIVVGCIVMIALFAVIILRYVFDADLLGLSGKTFWDWLQLLIVPVMLAVGGYIFTYRMSRNEQVATEKRTQADHEIALDNQREAMLQDYIDKISELLLHEHLSELKTEYSEVQRIARARTLTTLPRLDGKRKRSVLQFLYESNLIDRDKPIVTLHEADLRGADLSRVNRQRLANWSRANLQGANLWLACLDYADLSHANLQGADLCTSLMEATLENAYLAVCRREHLKP